MDQINRSIFLDPYLHFLSLIDKQICINNARLKQPFSITFLYNHHHQHLRLSYQASSICPQHFPHLITQIYDSIYFPNYVMSVVIAFGSGEIKQFFSTMMYEKLIPEKESSGDERKPGKPEQIKYLTNINCYDKFSFGWILPVIKFSNNHDLKQDNLEDLIMEEQSQSVYGEWHSHWQTELAKNKQDPLKKSLQQTFSKRYCCATVFDFLAYQLTVLTPLIIYSIARLLQDQPSDMFFWSVFWIIVTPILRFLRSLVDAHGAYQLTVLGCDISNCVALGMVNKSLRYSTLCNKKFKLGEIANLMQVDCFRLSLYPKSFNGIIIIIYVLIFSIAFMGVLVNFAFVAGLLVLIVAGIFNMCISKCTAAYQKDIALGTDNRMKITNEIFNNIKFVKVNAWEEYFYDKVIHRRNQQVGWFQKKFLAEAWANYSMWFFPKMILLATFGVYVTFGGNLTPPIAFSIMNMYGYIQFYLQFLPNYISVVIQCNNALKRIQAFLLAEQIDISCITYNQYDSDRPNSVEVQNGNFYWDKETEENVNVQPDLTLKDINFTIKRGEMVAVIGDIGSGKSSLMYSLLGEMKFKENQPKPRVTVNGTLSLVTQKPWIVNDTVRNNILFGKPFNKKKYEEIIHYACLKRDFQLFTNGDSTMIGEKGATLSGGQKARISFARSLYSESDILLLDDLLSAVDVHVGKFLMTETLMQFCRSRTRVLITHALYYLKYVDKILILENGKIVEQGNYDTIRNTNRFKDIYSNIMKDEKKARSESINLLQIQAAEKDNGEAVDEEDKILAEVIKEASIHTKKSRTQTAIDREKLQKLRARRSEHPKGKVQAKKEEVVVVASPDANDLMMSEQDKGDVGFGLYKSFAKYNKGYGFMGLIVLVQIGWMACNSGSNLWVAMWTERTQRIAYGEKDFSDNFYIAIYAAISLVYATFAFIRALALAYSYPKMSTFIHESMISNLLFSSLNEFFDRVPLGRIFNRLSKDLSSVDNSLPAFFNSTLVFLFFLASSLLVALVIAPIYIFAPAIVVYLILCHNLRSFVVKPLRQLTRMEGVSKSPIVSCFSEILSGVCTIRSYNVKDMFFHKNCQKINENKKPIQARKAAEVWFTFRLTIVSFLINLVSLGYILFFASKNNSTGVEKIVASARAGLLLISTLALDQVMYFLYVNLNAFENQLISIERCEAFMNLQPESGYKQYLKNREELKIKSKERRIMKADGWPDRGRIDFIDFKCRYRKNLDLVLRGLTVTFQGGHKIGVVGRTGSGKSTIMMCLLRILEAADGKIILDGRDISQLSLDDLRSKITIILQDPCLFAGTIRENLDPLQEYSDEQLSRALRQCALDETMNSRKGLETEITENGENLSVGERQLVSIARAILKPTRIVLVDEATANIDVRTESVIYKAMNESFKNSTVITVAHRLNTVINSDRILVLQGGTLKQYDNPQQLLKNPNSFFAQLYNESQKQNKM